VEGTTILGEKNEQTVLEKERPNEKRQKTFFERHCVGKSSGKKGWSKIS